MQKADADCGRSSAMIPSEKSRRFVFQTRGVCPQEIHFRISGDCIENVRFVGGGCPGNALLVSRLLEGRSPGEVKALLEGIACRNGTSCPDQLAAAIQAAEAGELSPAESFRTGRDPVVRHRIALVGDIGGDVSRLQALLDSIQAHQPDAVYCIGNLTGNSPANGIILSQARKAGILHVQGDLDWRYAQAAEAVDLPPLEQKARDWLLRRPQVLTFSLGDRKGLAFYGDFIQRLPGYSDFEPYALEINLICGLTRFMSDETVFPALEAMLPQFTVDLVLFAQTGEWGHWQLGGRDFIGLGGVQEGARPTWGLLESVGRKIEFSIVTAS